MANTDPRFPAFLQVVRQVSLETEQQLPNPLAYLEAIDQLFVDWLQDAGSTKPPTAAVLVLNAHASYRAGLTLALSGQLLPVFMTLRGALESALYANAIVCNPKLETVWLHRNHDEKSHQLCRKEFTVAKMLGYLADAQGREFADSVQEAYDSTIDFGAHPNSRSMLSSTAITERPDGAHALDFAYIHGPQSFELQQAFVACADIGYLAFLITLVASKDHQDLKVLNDRALVLRDGLGGVIRALGLGHPDL